MLAPFNDEPFELPREPLSELESEVTLSAFKPSSRLWLSTFGFAAGVFGEDAFCDCLGVDSNRELDVEPRRFSDRWRCGVCMPDTGVVGDVGDSAAAARLGRLTGGCAPSTSTSLRTLAGGVVRNPSMRFSGTSGLACRSRRAALSPTDDACVCTVPFASDWRGALLDSDAGFICGLPPERFFSGIAIAAVPVGDAPFAIALAFVELFTRPIVRSGLRSVGVATRRDPVIAPAVASALTAASRMALMSAGMGTRCTMLTAGQSAGWIITYSLASGARQHPGHPGLCIPSLLADGGVLWLAHCIET